MHPGPGRFGFWWRAALSVGFAFGAVGGLALALSHRHHGPSTFAMPLNGGEGRAAVTSRWERGRARPGGLVLVGRCESLAFYSYVVDSTATPTRAAAVSAAGTVGETDASQLGVARADGRRALVVDEAKGGGAWAQRDGTGRYAIGAFLWRPRRGAPCSTRVADEDGKRLASTVYSWRLIAG